jgi:hypothetical protein
MARIILGILRQAAEPMTARDIAVQFITERTLDQSDEKLARIMTKRVGVAFRGCGDRDLPSQPLGRGSARCGS